MTEGLEYGFRLTINRRTWGRGGERLERNEKSELY